MSLFRTGIHFVVVAFSLFACFFAFVVVCLPLSVRFSLFSPWFKCVVLRLKFLPVNRNHTQNCGMK